MLLQGPGSPITLLPASACNSCSKRAVGAHFTCVETHPADSTSTKQGDLTWKIKHLRGTYRNVKYSRHMEGNSYCSLIVPSYEALEFRTKIADGLALAQSSEKSTQYWTRPQKRKRGEELGANSIAGGVWRRPEGHLRSSPC